MTGGRVRRRWGAAVGLAWAAALAGCSVTPPADRSAAALPPPSAYKPSPSAGDMCLEQLSSRGITYEIVPTYAMSGGCGLVNGVRVERLLAPFNVAATLSCPMALRLDEFEINVVQMAAQRYFSRRVVEIRQVGSYSCRNIAGSHRISMHASGQAIDIAGFVLDDGRVITVKNDWSGRGAPTQFLHEVARGACGLFSVVLTPNTNADHHEHLHLDLGPWPLCDA